METLSFSLQLSLLLTVLALANHINIKVLIITIVLSERLKGLGVLPRNLKRFLNRFLGKNVVE